MCQLGLNGSNYFYEVAETVSTVGENIQNAECSEWKVIADAALLMDSYLLNYRGKLHNVLIAAIKQLTSIMNLLIRNIVL